jgi:1,4-alpha-glucan branching enzyme
VVYVQFDLEAPNAQSVSVAGDFDGWAGRYSLEDPDGDGTWTGRVPLEPGVHAYMFLVDGTEWMTDPDAQRYAEDGFGNRNAILAVAGPSA